MRQKLARSAAVLNRPAWPATPPMRRAVGSCTTPRSIVISGPWHGQPKRVQLSVGAIRGASDAGGLNIVSLMPSGSKMRSRANRSSGMPADALHDVAEQKEVDVAVDEALAGTRRRHLVDGERDRRLVAHPQVGKIDVGPQPGDVRQQVTDR